ncbi:TetR/AcrR family transcriptional regulator [Pseudomonas sp. BLCC-B13]|jgi:AcrR family transcriptional regulator|uniref:TetR/AcrR family transcriptional regulator n=1 Tax=Pseudomonas sp. BLCC-B13 TaxID=3025314 RepID=UPI00234F68F6|nr:TetR/AcrR family transcriptional regulator [Pseudomonas sp. BLCC-B13]MDC7827427.1 TetR/AcrR family transcriptional regulator [Pseudomonas sp. BLCC-B13]
MSESPSCSTPNVKHHESEPELATRRGRPVGDHSAKRAELLAAAIAVIAQDGYAGASMRKVAQHAGCTTGAVTYYFANKEEMVSAVAQNLFDKVEALLETNREQLDIKLLLHQWHQWISLDDPDSWLAWLQLLTHARHEPAFANVIKQRHTRFRLIATSLLKEGQQQGKIRSDIPADLLADHVSAFSDGWLMMLPIEPERFISERGQALLDAFILMISPSPVTTRTSRPKASAN